MGRRDFQTPDRQTLRGTCVEAKQHVPAWIGSRRPLAVPLTATRWAVPACGSLEICAPPAALPPTLLSAVGHTPRTPEIRDTSRQAAPVVVVLIRATTFRPHRASAQRQPRRLFR